MNTLQNKMKNHGETIKDLCKLNDDTFAVLYESITSIADMVNDARCEASADGNAIQGQLVAHIFEETVRKSLDDILSASFSGTLSPMLITAVTLHKIMAQHAILKDSLLFKEPILAYRFARIYPIRIDFGQRIFGYPRSSFPIESDIRPFYELYNVGYNVPTSNTTMKVPLPQFAQETGSPHNRAFTEIRIEGCEKGIGLWLCSPQAYLASSRTACLQAVLADRVDLVEECLGQIQVQQQAQYTNYATTPSGVLLRTGLREIVVTETPTLQHVSRGVSTPVLDNGVMWFPHGTYYHIVAGDLVLTSAVEVEQQFVELPSDFTHLNLTPIDHAPSLD